MGKSKNEQQAEQRLMLTTSDYMELDRQRKEKERADITIAKAWLSRSFKINERIRITEQNIEFWRTLANKATSNPSEILVDGNSGEQGGRVQVNSVKILDAIHDNEVDLEYLVNVKSETDWTISLVDDDVCRMLLQERYSLFKSWENVAVALKYNVDHVRKYLHFKALKNIMYFIKSAIALGSEVAVKSRKKYNPELLGDVK